MRCATRSCRWSPSSASRRRFLVGGLIVTETVFNIPGVARFLVEAILLARLPDRAEPRDADRLRGGHGQFPGRHGLHGPRPPHQVRGLEATMAVINHDAELARAGANVTGWWSRILFFARRYPLGAVGAVIVLVFVADRHLRRLSSRRWIRRRPTPRPRWPVRAASSGWAPTSWAATCSAASSSARAFRSPSASAPPCAAASWAFAIGLMSGYLGGTVDLVTQRLMDIMQSLPLLVMALVMAAALGPSLREHHHRHRHPAGADRGPRRALQRPCRCASSPSSRRRAPSAWARCASPCATCCPTPWRR